MKWLKNYIISSFTIGTNYSILLGQLNTELSDEWNIKHIWQIWNVYKFWMEDLKEWGDLGTDERIILKWMGSEEISG